MPVFEARGLSVWLGERRLLCDVTLAVPRGGVTALMGPSGCGKTAFVRALNRMNECHDGALTRGEVRFEGRDVYGPAVDVRALRRRAGMVFRAPQMLPGTVHDNVSYGLRAGPPMSRDERDARVERALARAGLWVELRDRLGEPAAGLSNGAQQRLCVARALALDPAVLLLDEPAATLDPVETATLEEALSTLRDELTVVIVTHAMEQAARVSQTTAFFHRGSLVEVGDTRDVFTRPRREATEDYLTGRFG